MAILLKIKFKIMAQRFSQKEAMIACWYLVLYVDKKSDKTSERIQNKLMKRYGLWSEVDWDRFLEKWDKWQNEDGPEKILNHCKKILDNADYAIRIKTLAGMWSIAVDIGDKEWTDGESEYYIAMERALNVSRDDVKTEWKKI